MKHRLVSLLGLCVASLLLTGCVTVEYAAPKESPSTSSEQTPIPTDEQSSLTSVAEEAAESVQWN